MGADYNSICRPSCYNCLPGDTDNKIYKDCVTDEKLKVQKYFYGASVNKIVKKTLLNNLISGEVGVNTTEDLLYATEILLKAKNICIMNAAYLRYRRKHKLTISSAFACIIRGKQSDCQEESGG